MFHADRVIIRLPCGQGQLSRIWKVQCDWLSLGKECCLRFSRHLWGGMKDGAALKHGIRNPESGNGNEITETESETETETETETEYGIKYQ